MMRIDGPDTARGWTGNSLLLHASIRDPKNIPIDEAARLLLVTLHRAVVPVLMMKASQAEGARLRQTE